MTAVISPVVASEKHRLILRGHLGVIAPLIGAPAAADQTSVERICHPYSEPVVGAVIIGIVAHGLAAPIHVMSDEIEALVVGRRQLQPFAGDVGLDFRRTAAPGTGSPALGEGRGCRLATRGNGQNQAAGLLPFVFLPGKHDVGPAAFTGLRLDARPRLRRLPEIDRKCPQPVSVDGHELARSLRADLVERHGNGRLSGSYGLLRLGAGGDRKYDDCRKRREQLG